MCDALIDQAGNHGSHWWQSRLWHWLGLTVVVVFLSASLVAQDTGSQSGGDDSAINSLPTPETQPALSADRIISVLLQQPELLATAKEAVASQLAVDPGTIKDDTVYDQIRQDPDLRARITDELNRRGYDVSPDMDTEPTTQGRGTQKSGAREKTEAQPSDDEDLNEPPTPPPAQPFSRDWTHDLSRARRPESQLPAEGESRGEAERRRGSE